MTLGEVRKFGTIADFFPSHPLSTSNKDHAKDSITEISSEAAIIGRNSSLLELVMRWQAEDLVERGPRESVKRLAREKAKTEISEKV